VVGLVGWYVWFGWLAGFIDLMYRVILKKFCSWNGWQAISTAQVYGYRHQSNDGLSVVCSNVLVYNLCRSLYRYIAGLVSFNDFKHDEDIDSCSLLRCNRWRRHGCVTYERSSWFDNNERQPPGNICQKTSKYRRWRFNAVISFLSANRSIVHSIAFVASLAETSMDYGEFS
jgi:hypothetical protein